jgi:hypothetical protein
MERRLKSRRGERGGEGRGGEGEKKRGRGGEERKRGELW